MRLPESWKKDIKTDQGNCQNLLYLNHHLLKNQIYSIEKLKANELCSLSISFLYRFTWKDVYILPGIVTINMRLHIFQYVLNNTYNLRNIFFLQSER